LSQITILSKTKANNEEKSDEISTTTNLKKDANDDIKSTICQDDTESSNIKEPLLNREKTTKDENVDKNSETGDFEKVGNQNDASISIVLQNQQCSSQTKISSPPTKISQLELSESSDKSSDDSESSRELQMNASKKESMNVGATDYDDFDESLIKLLTMETIVDVDSETTHLDTEKSNVGKINDNPLMNDDLGSKKVIDENSGGSSDTNKQKEANDRRDAVESKIEATKLEPNLTIKPTVEKSSKLDLKDSSASNNLIRQESETECEFPVVGATVEGNLENKSASLEINGEPKLQKNVDVTSEAVEIRDKKGEEDLEESFFPPTTERNSIVSNNTVTASTYGISEVVSAARVARRLKARRSIEKSKEEYKESILI